MKTILGAAFFLSAGASLVTFLAITFTHIDTTSTRLLVTYWPVYLGGIVLTAILGWLWTKETQ